MKRTIHTAIVPAVILVFALLVSGCSHTATSETPKYQEQTNLPESRWTNGGANHTQESISESTPEQKASKEIAELVLGGIGIEGGMIQSIVNDFNRSSSSCHVVIEDYYVQTGSLPQAKIVMQTKAISGQTPDMIFFENISPLGWIAADLLLDMDEFVSADSDIQKDDILIWDALHEYGGMYLCAPTFYIEALSCSADTLREHDGWTIEEYLQAEKQLRAGQDMTYGMTSTEFLRNIGGRYLRTAMDLKNATCNLITDEFRSILSGSVQAGEYEASFNPNKNVPQRIISGDLVCCYVQLTSGAEVSFDRYRCGQTLSYIGWPTPDGSNGFDVTLPMSVGISAGTTHKEACWEFIKYMLQHPYINDSYSGTPVYAPLLDTQLKILNEIGLPYETTAEDISIVTDIAKTCKTLAFYDETALEIILEEAAALKQNEIDIYTAIERIQSRVSLYVAEQYG